MQSALHLVPKLSTIKVIEHSKRTRIELELNRRAPNVLPATLATLCETQIKWISGSSTVELSMQIQSTKSSDGNILQGGEGLNAVLLCLMKAILQSKVE
jgi:hypothetical protein